MPEKELDAESALSRVAPIADFAHDPAAELVEPLDDVDDVECDNILRTNVTILLLCTAIRSKKHNVEDYLVFFQPVSAHQLVGSVQEEGQTFWSHVCRAVEQEEKN